MKQLKIEPSVGYVIIDDEGDFWCGSRMKHIWSPKWTEARIYSDKKAAIKQADNLCGHIKILPLSVSALDVLEVDE